MTTHTDFVGGWIMLHDSQRLTIKLRHGDAEVSLTVDADYTRGLHAALTAELAKLDAKEPKGRIIARVHCGPALIGSAAA